MDKALFNSQGDPERYIPFFSHFTEESQASCGTCPRKVTKAVNGKAGIQTSCLHTPNASSHYSNSSLAQNGNDL